MLTILLTEQEAKRLIKYFLKHGIDDEWVRVVALKLLDATYGELTWLR